MNFICTTLWLYVVLGNFKFCTLRTLFCVWHHNFKMFELRCRIYLSVRTNRIKYILCGFMVGMIACSLISENIRFLPSAHNQGNPVVLTMTIMTFTLTISGPVVNAHMQTPTLQSTTSMTVSTQQILQDHSDPCFSLTYSPKEIQL